MNDQTYFDSCRAQFARPEDVWQAFFESNPWIFGYGLDYVLNSPLEGRKLEQVVSGATAFNSGKRTEALMRTRAAVSTICLGEIKTHQTKLLSGTSPRSDTWSPSRELVDAVAQSQRTVQHAMSQIRSRVLVTDEVGSPTGEELFMYLPKSILVIGRLEEFHAEHGINESKFSSFELYRRQLVSPTIMTFDELFERARHIVEHAPT